MRMRQHIGRWCVPTLATAMMLGGTSPRVFAQTPVIDQDLTAVTTDDDSTDPEKKRGSTTSWLLGALPLSALFFLGGGSHGGGGDLGPASLLSDKSAPIISDPALGVNGGGGGDASGGGSNGDSSGGGSKGGSSGGGSGGGTNGGSSGGGTNGGSGGGSTGGGGSNPGINPPGNSFSGGGNLSITPEPSGILTSLMAAGMLGSVVGYRRIRRPR